MTKPPVGNCAFLVTQEYGLFDDDARAVEPLRSLGWQLTPVAWTDPGIDWAAFDLVVVRTPWDYVRNLALFEDTLTAIAAVAVLENPPDLLRWNLRKTYLRDLAAKGVPVVPTVFRDRLQPGEHASLFAEANTDDLVIKPVVGASAVGAFRVSLPSAEDRAEEIESFFAERELMAQPTVRAVLEEGEYSLLYFGGRFSHATLKTPRSGDFRVQRHHGGSVIGVTASPELVEAGDRVMAALEAPPLYARVDLVRTNHGRGFWLMELELIEPELFLRLDPESPARWARAVAERGKAG